MVVWPERARTAVGEFGWWRLAAGTALLGRLAALHGSAGAGAAAGSQSAADPRLDAGSYNFV